MRDCMKILVLNGSPKGQRSNTYRLTGAFLDGIRQEASDCEVREHSIKELDIKPCIGCFSCWNKTPGKCCIHDDMATIIEDMLWADVTVWSFPLYYFGIPGPMKNLMDRQLPMSLPFMTEDSESGGHPARYDMRGKRTVVISTCGFYTAAGNYDGVNATFDHLCGKGNYETVYCGQGELFRVKELHERTDAYLCDVRAAGREFCHGAITAETKAKLQQLLYPREIFESMADASWGVEKTGEKTDESLTFTRQMAALYNPASYRGKDIVLEMSYTDLGKRYQIILGKDGSQVIHENLLSATTTIETPYTVWEAIASGDISGEDALMQGKYRVKGDFNLMIHWDSYFGSQEPEQVMTPPQKKTNMALLLTPWIVFWIAASSMDRVTGAMLAITLTALAPLILFRNRMLVFDHISAAAVTILSLLLLADVPMDVILPASYLTFGILWTVNGFTRLPLTAHYSLNDYGGENMLRNPLFIKTNRILTLCWGILYLLMTLWTVLLLNLGMDWVGTVNSLLPMLMSFFTIWFQKWYPAKVARGK